MITIDWVFDETSSVNKSNSLKGVVGTEDFNIKNGCKQKDWSKWSTYSRIPEARILVAYEIQRLQH